MKQNINTINAVITFFNINWRSRPKKITTVRNRNSKKIGKKLGILKYNKSLIAAPETKIVNKEKVNIEKPITVNIANGLA